MVPYYGRHSCKQYIQKKPVKFDYKLWVAATPLGYCIQFYLFAGKDDSYNKGIVLGGCCYKSNVKVTNSPRLALPCSYG